MSTLNSSSATPATASSQTSSASQRPLRLRRVNHSDEVSAGFAKLLKNESLSDVTLIGAGGQAIRAHKVILSMFSPYFRSIFEAQPFANNPNTFPVIVMKDMGMQELKTIVEFIYKGEASVPREKLNSILQAAKALEVSGLADVKEITGGTHLASPSSSSESNPSQSPGANCSPNAGSGYGTISGALSGVGALGGNTLSVSGTAFKRGSDMEATTIYGGTGPDPQLKKLRITLDNGNDLPHSMDIGSGFVSTNFGTAGGGVVINDNSLDGVRSLLQQPPRLPQAFQQIRTHQQLQQFQQLQIQKQQRQLTSLQHLVQQRQLQQRQQQQRQMFQQQMKQQILQQQLMQKGSSKQFPIIKGSQGAQLMQFQQRIKAQLQDRQPRLTFTQTSSTLQERLLQKPVNQKSKSLDKTKEVEVKKEPVDEEKEQTNDGASSDERGSEKGSLKETQDGNNGNSAENGDDTNTETDASNSALNESKNTSKEDSNNNETGNEHDNEEPQGTDPEGSNSSRTGSGNGGNNAEEKTCDDIEEEDVPQTIASGVDDGVEYLEDEEESMANVEANEEEDEEYEVDIDKDLIFQRQQQLRLQQLQKQQQYQQQLQIQQEEQEQRLMEFHQQLQQANESNAGNEDVDDNGSGFGFDWQEGFIDDGFTPSSEQQEQATMTLVPATPITIPATPDFLQPRGPGRPRKGNKSTEISPCPECNKVFVRPDVLKLHYRSVHLNERHPCNLCPKIFKWPGDLSKHKRTKHPDQSAHNQSIQST